MCRLLLIVPILLIPLTLYAESDEAESPATAAQEGKPETGSAERFVMPVKTWLEDKAQGFEVLNPTLAESQKPRTTNKSALRQAIKKAQQAFPGTVLSASRTSGESVVSFKVKILSPAGVIKEISIVDSELEEHLDQ